MQIKQLNSRNEDDLRALTATSSLLQHHIADLNRAKQALSEV
jgi:hypothetical protein